MSVCEVPLSVPLLRGEELGGGVKGKEKAEYFYGPDGFGGTLLDYLQNHPDTERPHLREESAVDFLIRVTKEQPGEITVVCLAPLTNLAVAQK
jgi:purine nucleosidase